MKALVLKEYGVLSYEDVPLPEYGEDDVLIRVKACSICGSDIHGMDGSTGRRIPPVIMGHEASGVIERAGKKVKGYKIGDAVTFDSTVYCGNCYFCRQGKMNLCDNRKVLGVSCDDYRMNGAFAQYVSVPQHILYAIPDGVKFEHAAMVEPLSVALHAVRLTKVSLGNTAVIVGVGIIGLLVVQLLKASGCREIIAVDPSKERLDLACAFGATLCLSSECPDVASHIFRQTDGLGADIAFEAVGITQSIRTAVSGLKKNGSLILIGNLQPSVEMPLQTIVTRQLTLAGSCASNGEYPDCLKLIAAGKVDIDTLISTKAPLSEGAEWFKRLYNREAGLMKVVLCP